MLRILHVIGSMNCGGAETMIMNIYRNIDRSQVQFDFVIHTNMPSFYDDEIISLGGKIYRTVKYNVKNIYTYSKWWHEFLNMHNEYKIIHGHINSSAIIYLSIAQKYGLCSIVHSHATKITEKSIRSLAFMVVSLPVRYIADYFIACSLQAGIDRFGTKVVKLDNFMVLPNGIECERFKYNYVRRNKIRKEYCLSEDDFVIGHVGRFTYAKNHSFLIDIFYEFQKKNNAKLMLLGTGELEDKIRTKIKRLGIENKVLFVGVTSNVGNYLQAMDCFVFPSNFEGLGIALIEAQASGLPCVVSNAIQSEADIGAGLVSFLDVNDDVQLWVEKLKECKSIPRIDTTKYVKNAGFSIEHSSNLMYQLYVKMEKGIEG